ncbi:hypothetical protein ACA910_005002 [Epithemia clementina (nom. ined.)]
MSHHFLAYYHFFFLLSFSYSFLLCCVCSLDVVFCKATPKEVALARQLILKEKMNPLSITQAHLLIAKRGEEHVEPGNGNEDNFFLGFGQIRPLTDHFSELASLYVLPQFRRQGIGMAIIQELLARHDGKYQSSHGDAVAIENTTPPRVCLLTIRPTMPLYEKCGFTEVEDISTMPAVLQFEYQAGSVISKILSNKIVCMERKPRTEI